jgi:PAS domain S-box-containing protein
MKRLHDLSIARKLTAITMLTVVSALLITCAGLIAYERITFQKAMTRDLSITAKMIGFNSAAGLSFDDADSVAQTLKGLGAQPHIVAACVYDASGRVFATYQRDSTADPLWHARQPDSERFGADVLELFRDIDFAGETIGSIYLQADLDEMNERLRRYAGIALAVTLAASLAAFLLSSRLQRIVSHPLSQLATVAGRVAAENDYSVRAWKHGDDELGRLIDGFNHMLAQIEARDADLKAAHDHLERRVTERTFELQRAQERAAREQARFKFIFESLPVGVTWMISGQLQTRLVNASYARISGVELHERFRLERFREQTHPDDRARQDLLHAKLVAGEIDHYTMEKRYVRPDGTTHWGELTVRFFRNVGEGETQEIGTLVDLTERKQAEERLAASLSVLHATFQATIDGVLVVDRQRRVTTHNQKFGEIWRLPEMVLDSGDDARFTETAMRQIRDPAAFTKKVRELYDDPEAESFDILELIDGRVIERISQPQRIDGASVGRVWFFRDITERKRAEARLEIAHRRLLETSRQAGMAEVATGVLHNVGNVLNSVNVSTALLADHVRQSKIDRVARLHELLRAQAHDLEAFFRSERGRRLPGFLEALAKELASEQAEVLTEIDLLRKNIDHIKDIVAMQQSYARVSGVAETVPVHELVEDALRMNASALSGHDIAIVRDYRSQPVITVEKHKVLQVLVNLLRNASHACEESKRDDKQVIIRVSSVDGRVQIAVIDNGVGIAPENRTRIFAHGFTTRPDGHGFGLHNGALAARELKGSLTAQSEGRGQGATFILELPERPDAAAEAT